MRCWMVGGPHHGQCVELPDDYAQDFIRIPQPLRLTVLEASLAMEAPTVEWETYNAYTLSHPTLSAEFNCWAHSTLSGGTLANAVWEFVLDRAAIPHEPGP